MPVGQVNCTAGTVQVPGIVTPPLPPKKDVGFIYLRELFGTAIFTYIACIAESNILPAGLIYAVLQASSEISSSGGLHLNPVLSLAAAISGKITEGMLFVPMIVLQFMGALLGAGFCLASQTKEQFLNDRSTLYHYRSTYNLSDKKDLYRYCFGEFLLTCILVMVFLRLFPLRTPSVPVTKEEIRDYQKRKYIHAIFVGLTICALTGAMHHTTFIGLMNPFRAFGPMAVWVAMTVKPPSEFGPESDELFKGHWVYWAGPFIAGVVVGIGERIIGYIQSRKVQ